MPLPNFLKKKHIVFFLGNFIQNLFLTKLSNILVLTNLKLVYIVFKQFDNRHISCL